MKIGFDISQTAFSGGVATYTKELSLGLGQLSDLEMVYFYFSLRKPYKGNLKNVKQLPIPPTITEILFNRFHKIPIEFFIGDVDIFHSSDWIQPATQAKKVTTYHDVVPLKYPEWSHPKIVDVHKRRIEIVEKEIDMVIAVSEATKRDLLEVSSLSEDKIKVIYEAAGDQFKPQDPAKVEGFRKRMNLPAKFILSIGGIGERRNLGRVKEAAKNYDLVITGETIPFILDQELPLLYSAAKVLLYPSLYEGFGLPIIEAMSCGTPVITSNISSMPEVGGDAAIYVNPNDVEDIEKKIKMVMEDIKLEKDLKEKGFKQAQRFSWKKCVQETITVYKNILGNQ